MNKYQRRDRDAKGLYRSWQYMHQRCSSKSHFSKYYYDRGIKVCGSWNDFKNFKDDMGKKPVGTTLDRIDNDGNYEPGNCRWATRKQQANNTRKTRILSFNGENKPLSVWAEEIGIKSKTLLSRLNDYGWSVEKSLTTPVKKGRALVISGVSKSPLEWSRVSGINLSTIRSRINRYGWSDKDAVFKKVRSSK